MKILNLFHLIFFVLIDFLGNIHEIKESTFNEVIFFIYHQKRKVSINSILHSHNNILSAHLKAKIRLDLDFEL